MYPLPKELVLSGALTALGVGIKWGPSDLFGGPPRDLTPGPRRRKQVSYPYASLHIRAGKEYAKELHRLGLPEQAADKSAELSANERERCR